MKREYITDTNRMIQIGNKTGYLEATPEELDNIAWFVYEDAYIIEHHLKDESFYLMLCNNQYHSKNLKELEHELFQFMIDEGIYKNLTVSDAVAHVMYQLTPFDREYAKKEGFCALHDLFDANMLLPQNTGFYDSDMEKLCSFYNEITDRVSEILTKGDTIESLTDEYKAYCEFHNLPHISADEHDLSTFNYSADVEYIKEFITRWDTAQAKEAKQ